MLKNIELEEGLIRHTALNSIRAYKKKFTPKYGEMVICSDSKSYWRKDIFAYYKAKRKKNREESGLDWHVIFSSIDTIKEELRSYFPYKVIEIDGCEADDVIATLARKYSEREPVLILSSDKDFQQLQRFHNIDQYSTVQKKFLVPDDPRLFLKEHIMRGDAGDGVPNFLSSDDTLVLNKRQKSISNKKIDEWMFQAPEDFCLTEGMLRGYKRNQLLIDLDNTPMELQNRTIEEYENAVPARGQLMKYFMDKKLRNLAEAYRDFL
jgi:hypothetical protein